MSRPVSLIPTHLGSMVESGGAPTLQEVRFGPRFSQTGELSQTNVNGSCPWAVTPEYVPRTNVSFQIILPIFFFFW